MDLKEHDRAAPLIYRLMLEQKSSKAQTPSVVKLSPFLVGQSEYCANLFKNDESNIAALTVSW